MKILITGNMGYVGPSVVKQLRREIPSATLIGFDMGYFAHCLSASAHLPECQLDEQHFGDVRKLPDSLLQGVDAVIHLAALSNDPIGSRYEEISMDINFRASVEIARRAKRAGVRDVILPVEVKTNVEEDLTDDQTEGVTIHYATRFEDVLNVALPKTVNEVVEDEEVREEVLAGVE